MASAFTPLTSVWAAFNLTDNPFRQDPVETYRAMGRHPLFVGRAQEVEQLAQRVVSNDCSWAVVQAPAGFGKTSVANAVKARLYASKAPVLFHPTPISVGSATGPDELFTRLLTRLVTMRESLPPRDRGSDRFWNDLGERLEGGERRAIGVGAGPLSGSHARSRVAPELRGDQPEKLFLQALDRLQKSSRRALLFHLNDLENLSDNDAGRASALLKDVRATLRHERTHWLFVGSGDVFARVFQPHPQLSGMVGIPVTLGALTPEELLEMLARRYAVSAVAREKPVPPIAPEAVAALYATYEGNLRDFLAVLESAVWRSGRTHALTLDDVLSAVRPEFRRMLVARLSDEDVTAVETTVAQRWKAGERTIRPTDFVTSGAVENVHQASRLVKRLEAAGVLSLERRKGVAKWYRIAGNDAVGVGAVG